MNIFECFDRYHKRKFILKQIKYYSKELDNYHSVLDKLSDNLMPSHIRNMSTLTRKKDLYEDKLNDLL